SEAVTNAIVHAGAAGPEAPPIQVRITGDADHVCVDVVDRGRGFTPGERAPTTGLGLGLVLIDRLCDRARVESGGGGTRVSMCFAAARRPDTC
ncbi:MAG TPA: ATP-binding protein, partial [Miltoncostaeaceae bacterium]|nr:ATP-binding protein [Miltoncostaeaceae bacterium]